MLGSKHPFSNQQGCVIRRIPIIRCIVRNAYFTVFWGESGPFWVKNWHSQNCLKLRSYYTRIPYLTRILPY
jgi:hypothetical protein